MPRASWLFLLVAPLILFALGAGWLCVWLGSLVEAAGPAPPRVLVITTHPHEAYLPELGAAGRSGDEAFASEASLGVQEVARYLAASLAARDVGTLRLRTDAYTNYEALRLALRLLWLRHPSLVLLVDVHRDAPGLAQTLYQGPPEAARYLFVVGLGARGALPTMPPNANLAEALCQALNAKHAGVCRGVYYKPYHYNQDLGERSLLVEVGGVENTMAQARQSAEWLAEEVVAALPRLAPRGGR